MIMVVYNQFTNGDLYIGALFLLFFFYHIFKEIVYLQPGLEKFSFNLLRGKQIDHPHVLLVT